MTNRQIWEQRLHAMTDEAFANVICNSRLQDEMGTKMCQWCRAVYPGRDCSENNICPEEADYLRSEVIA